MTGIDKQGRIDAEALAERERVARQARSLDPPFPFVVIPFDLALMDLPVDPDESDAS